MVAVALEKAGAALMTVCVKHGMNEERVAMHWGTVRPAIENMVVVLGGCVLSARFRVVLSSDAGDLVEQHPDLLSALLITGAVMLIPEYLVLRPLLSLFGFGPMGPVKGTQKSKKSNTPL